MKKGRVRVNLIVLISALTLLLIAAFVYLTFFYKSVEVTNNNYTNVSDFTTASKTFNDLILNNKIENISSLERNISNFNDLTNQEKLNIAIKGIVTDGSIMYEGGLATSLIDEYFIKVFKDKINYSKDAVECWCKTPIYVYDKDKDVYIYNEDHGGHGSPFVENYFTRILSIKSYNNIYKVEAVHLWAYYPDMGPATYDVAYDTHNNALNQENPLFTLNIENPDEDNYQRFLLEEINNNFAKYKDKMAIYTYTFEKIDNDYKLTNFEFKDK